MFVGDDRDFAAHDGQRDRRADQVPVALVGGMNRDRGVTQHGLHPGGRDDDGPVPLAVPDRDELALVIGVLHLDVGQGGLTAGAPVGDPVGPIDQPVVEQTLENRTDGPGEPVVQSEPLPGPVDGIAEPAHLAQDHPAGFFLPVPHLLDEEFPAEVVARFPVDGEPLLDHVLRRDARMIHPGQPQCLVAGHPMEAALDVHDRVIQGMADVQAAGHVRRRQHDGERLLLPGQHIFGVGDEVAGRLPAMVGGHFDTCGVILVGQFTGCTGRDSHCSSLGGALGGGRRSGCAGSGRHRAVADHRGGPASTRSRSTATESSAGGAAQSASSHQVAPTAA